MDKHDHRMAADKLVGTSLRYKLGVPMAIDVKN